jgi:predicted RNA-binding Zn-ribbon protein involved in translation (DUF1610 family)
MVSMKNRRGDCMLLHRVVILTNEFIGFSNSYDNGYCKKCGNMFTYHWNGCNPLSEDKTCPKCGSFEDVESEYRIESHISMLRMFIHNDDLTNEEQKKKMRKEINELNRIRRELDKYNEEREKI